MNTIIQFLHPGSEHDDKSGKNWNTGNHKRKYLKANGSYLQDISSKPLNGTLYFWGEWEAQSKVTTIASVINPNNPRYIFEPYYQPTNKGTNTDPFIFGNQFYYRLCLQQKSTTLKTLEQGDVILFGSCLNKQFVLDTVFVVKNYMPYLPDDDASYFENK